MAEEAGAALPILIGMYVYPIKGAQGITLQSGYVGELGLKHDRRWMLVDPDGSFVSQRHDPALARLSVAIEGEDLVFSTDDRPPLAVRPRPDRPAIMVQVHADRLLAHPNDQAADRWFGEWLGYPVRLVWCPENTDRHVAPGFGGSSHRMAFTDDFPFLLTSTASLTDLNARLRNPVPMDRFRPNLVISGLRPYEEDEWDEVRIGAVRFKATKRTGRCLVITTDQSTGIRETEPLQTLAGYRTSEGRVRFGRNLVHLTTGWVSIGDRVNPESGAGTRRVVGA